MSHSYRALAGSGRTYHLGIMWSKDILFQEGDYSLSDCPKTKWLAGLLRRYSVLLGSACLLCFYRVGEGPVCKNLCLFPNYLFPKGADSNMTKQIQTRQEGRRKTQSLQVPHVAILASDSLALGSRSLSQWIFPRDAAEWEATSNLMQCSGTCYVLGCHLKKYLW